MAPNILITRPQLQRNKGFTLLELIIGIALSSILMGAVCSIMYFSTNISKLGEIEDEILLNGRYGIEFLKEEIRDVDKIISSDKIVGLNDVFPSNIGFLLMKDSKIEGSDDRYKFITYYLKDDELIRIARNKKSSTYPKATDLAGYNGICKGVLSIKNTSIDWKNKLVKLNLSVGIENREIHCFKSTIFIKSEFDK